MEPLNSGIFQKYTSFDLVIKDIREKVDKLFDIGNITFVAKI